MRNYELVAWLLGSCRKIGYGYSYILLPRKDHHHYEQSKQASVGSFESFAQNQHVVYCNFLQTENMAEGKSVQFSEFFAQLFHSHNDALNYEISHTHKSYPFYSYCLSSSSQGICWAGKTYHYGWFSLISGYLWQKEDCRLRLVLFWVGSLCDFSSVAVHLSHNSLQHFLWLSKQASR